MRNVQKIAANILLISALTISFFGFSGMSHSSHAHDASQRDTHGAVQTETSSENPCIASASTGKNCQHETPLNSLAYHMKALKDFSLADMINLTLAGLFLLLGILLAVQLFSFFIKIFSEISSNILEKKLFFKKNPFSIHTNIFEANTKNWLNLARIAAA